MINRNVKASVCILCIAVLSILVFSCGDDEPQLPSFDRNEFLAVQADQEILPRIELFISALDRCKTAIENMTVSPTAVSVTNARNKFKTAYLAWQKVNFLNFGPGAKEGLKLSLAEELGLFPLDVEEIEKRIAEASTKVDDHRRDTRGLLAIDYILHRHLDAQVLADAMDDNTASYLLAVMTKVSRQVEDFDNAWKSYRDEFVAANGTDVKSSTTQYYNDWLRSYELLKNLKFTEPLGLKAGQTESHPELVECINSGNSLLYARAHFDSMVEVFRNGNQDLIAWTEYLSSIQGGADLVSRINTQMDIIASSFNAVPTNKSLKELVAEENEEVVKLQQELQNLIPMIKSEMSSLLGIAITFSTTDGD